MKKVLLLVLCVFFVNGCGILNQTETNITTSSQPEDSAVALAKNLQVPWSINKVDGEFYISERPGTIAHILPDGTVERQKVALSSPLAEVAEAGLLGFVLKPDFAKTKSAYAYYNYDEGNGPFNRIVTLKLENGSWKETGIHLDGISTGNVHHGGRLEIGSDNLLYATIGDAANPMLAQDPNSYNGKIIRLKADGQWEIFSLGHRNPQGVAWNENGVLFESEHGQSAHDEINLVEKGKNYGWPVVEGDEEQEGLIPPILHSGADTTWAPSGMAFHKGKLYVAALRGEGILVVNPDTGELQEHITGFGRVRDVHSDGDNLYFVTNNTDGRGTPGPGDDILYRYRGN